jgi:hypothetical protein
MAKPKVSHLQKTRKSDLEERRPKRKSLQWNSSLSLKSPDCPEQLHDAIIDCLNELQSATTVTNVDFLLGLFLSKPRQAEGSAQ